MMIVFIDPPLTNIPHMIHLAYIRRKRHTSFYTAACCVSAAVVTIDFRKVYWLPLLGFPALWSEILFLFGCTSDRALNLNNRTFWHLCAKQHRMCIGYA